MCPLSPEGSNAAMILFGSDSSERFFDSDISLRGNGAIRELYVMLIVIVLNSSYFNLTILFLHSNAGPSAMILFVNPPGTDRFLANSTTPILSPQRSATVIQSKFNLPTKHIVTEGTDINGFILSDCSVSILFLK